MFWYCNICPKLKSSILCNVGLKSFCFQFSVADPHCSYADPDPQNLVNADPDP